MKLRRSWTVAATALSLAVGSSVALAAEDLKIGDGMKVTLEYTLTLPDKTVDSNVGQEPLTYTHGQHEIVPGLEKALTGMKAGQKKHVMVPADQGYGPYDEKARVTVEKDRVPPNIQPGTMLRASNGQIVKVLEVSDQAVVLDTNHPLAGKDLTFDVTVLKVEKGGKADAGKSEAPAKHGKGGK